MRSNRKNRNSQIKVEFSNSHETGQCKEARKSSLMMLLNPARETTQGKHFRSCKRNAQEQRLSSISKGADLVQTSWHIRRPNQMQNKRNQATSSNRSRDQGHVANGRQPLLAQNLNWMESNLTEANQLLAKCQKQKKCCLRCEKDRQVSRSTLAREVHFIEIEAWCLRQTQILLL